MKFVAALFCALLFSVSAFAQGNNNPTGGSFTPPNVGITCGTDGTAALQAALSTASLNNGMVYMPPCLQQTDPIVLSPIGTLGAGKSLDISSNTTIVCPLGTWLQWKANDASAAPLFENIGNANGTGTNGIQLNASIRIVGCNIDGNGANQSYGTKEKLAWFVGVADLTLEDVQFWNGPSDDLYIDGNGADVSPCYINNVYVNTTYASGTGFGFGQGVAITHAQRNCRVSNIHTVNTRSYGLNLDASQGLYENIRAEGAGYGASCSNSATSTVTNPGGGGSSQYSWSPCPAGIFVRNVTDESLCNFVAENNYYYGILIIGLKHATVCNLVANNNSLASMGTWNDLQFDLNNVVTGYGESSDLTIYGMHVGANAQDAASGAPNFSTATAAYGMYFADGITGSMAEMGIASAGSGYAANDVVSLTGGTSSFAAQAKITARSGTVPTTISRSQANGGNGDYTAFPSNPVSTTGGAGSGLTVNVTWTSGKIQGLNCGLTVTACSRLPSFTTGWTIDSGP